MTSSFASAMAFACISFISSPVAYNQPPSPEMNPKYMIRIRENTKLIPHPLLLQNLPPPIPLGIGKPWIPLHTNQQRRVFDILKVHGEVYIISRMGDYNCCKTIHSTQGQRMRSAPTVLPLIQSSGGSTPTSPMEEIPGRDLIASMACTISR